MQALPLSYSIKNLWRRKTTTILTMGGMAMVVFVFAATLMMASGLEKALEGTGSKKNCVALRKGAQTEVMSSITREQAAIIEMLPGVAIAPSDGRALAAREVVVLVTIPKSTGKGKSNVSVRGIGAKSAAIRTQIKMTAGRMPRAGTTEIIIGSSIKQRFYGVTLGATLRWGARDWVVVGIFDAGNTAFSSEIWADVDTLMQTFRRDAYSAVIFQKADGVSTAAIRNRLAGEPRLPIDIKVEDEYYREQSKMMALFLRILGMFLSVTFSIGAVIGAMITAQNAVANRVPEIGALRALGFQQSNILWAFLMEAILIGAISGVVGVLGASLMQLVTISTVNFQTFSEVAFVFTLTPTIVVSSLMFAIFMGAAGGMLPALRAAKLNVVDALRYV